MQCLKSHKHYVYTANLVSVKNNIAMIVAVHAACSQFIKIHQRRFRGTRRCLIEQRAAAISNKMETIQHARRAFLSPFSAKRGTIYRLVQY